LWFDFTLFFAIGQLKLQEKIIFFNFFSTSEIFIFPEKLTILGYNADHGYEPKQALETLSRVRCGVLYSPLRGIVQLTNSDALRFRIGVSQ
jgi:hypothetical protein